MSAPLEIRGLTLRLGGLVVLDGVDLEVEQAETLALIGPNGAGKTSLLNCVSGVYRPTSGHIGVEGRRIDHLPPHAVAEAGLGRTFQHVELFPQLSVADNVLVGRHRHFGTHTLLDAVYWGPSLRAEQAQRTAIEPFLALAGLESVRDARPGELPYGTQKLVGIARALALLPRVLLLDEPSAGMHAGERLAFARVLRCIRDELRIPVAVDRARLGARGGARDARRGPALRHADCRRTTSRYVARL